VVAGGTSAVNDAVFTQLKALASTVVRVQGANRYETSRALASYAFSSAATAYVATGDNFPDALPAGAAAAHGGGPLLLVPTSSNAQDAATVVLLKTLKVSSVRVAGGSAVVPDACFNAVKAAVSNTVRVSGSDRYGTSAVVSQNAFKPTTSTVVLAAGANYPDGMVAAPLAARTTSPLLLSQETCIPRTVITEMVRLGATKAILLGGTAVMTMAVAGVTVCP